jgi:Zn-dependent peptidase ImmA (M78 family)/DNA-binding XRE family transcriptional regulator
MPEAFVTPRLVRWARERNSLTADAAAQRVNVAVARLTAWEQGEERPTFRQAQNLAQKLNVPFGFLFLSAPPSEEIPLPDLRTLTGAPLRPPSPNFLDLVNDVLRKQQWYREYQESEEAQPVPFIGRFTLRDGPERIAGDIASTLGINNAMRQESPNWEQFLQEFIRRAERVGVLVLRSGIVENNTHRQLDVDEFRGFAISDSLAPLVFVNAQDAKTAQIFTLAHELAHLWIGESGISNPDHMRRPSQQPNEIDRLCDQVAAETLVPNRDFELRWQDWRSVDTNLQRLAIQYRVSQFVVLRRAYENDKITFEEYRAYYQELVANLRPRGSQGGGDFYRTLLARSSRTLTSALLAATAEGRISDRDAARLLNVKVRTVSDVRGRLLTGRLSDA